MEVISVNISEDKGTTKHPVDEIHIDESGVVGDAHAGAWHRQVSVLSREIVDEFEGQIGRKIGPGEFAENLTLRGIDLRGVCILDRLTAGAVEFEVTQIGKECHGEACAIFRETGKCVMPKEGIFCRVLKGGTIRAGDTMEHQARPLRFLVATLSDRASRGEYEDRSGPLIRRHIEERFAGKRWHLEMQSALLPDDSGELTRTLESARDAGTDVVFTTGGTGIGPRDIAPDVVAALADKTIPGIMEGIRAKCGAQNPKALLSRSVAAVLGRTIVYALPGSPRAVGEYMPEILRTTEHLLFMLHGLDVH